MDISQWITDEFLKDHTKEPIKIKIQNLSHKYNISIYIIAQPKEA